MIIKFIRPDGMSALDVECDTCTRREPLIGSEHWLIPADPGMPLYCLPCTATTARALITAALRL